MFAIISRLLSLKCLKTTTTEQQKQQHDPRTKLSVNSTSPSILQEHTYHMQIQKKVEYPEMDKTM